MSATTVQKESGILARRALNDLSRDELPARVARDIADLGHEQAVRYVLEMQTQLHRTLHQTMPYKAQCLASGYQLATQLTPTGHYVYMVRGCHVGDGRVNARSYVKNAIDRFRGTKPFSPEDAFLCVLDADIEKHPERVMDMPDDLEVLAASFRSKTKLDKNARLEGEGEVYL